MEIALLFAATLLAFIALLVYDPRVAFFLVVLFYGTYPRFFALGIAEDGFALTMQRAMFVLLLGMYLLRWLSGSKDVAAGLQTLSRYRVLLAALLVYLLARLMGNLLTGRMDLTVVAQLISESLISLFVVILVVTDVRTRAQIMIVLGLVMISLLFNQLLSIYEYLAQQPIFPAGLTVSYEIGGRGDAVLEGRTRNETFRAMGVFDNPLKLAMLLSISLPLVLLLAGCAKTTLIRLLAWLSVILALPTAWFTGSRAALGAVCLVLGWQIYRTVVARLQGTGRRVAIVCGVLASFALAALFADDIMRELLFGDSYARSTEARFLAYVTAPLALLESPLFGFGYSRNIAETLELGALDPFYMLLALEGGAVALLAFLVFLIGVIRMLGSTFDATQPAADVALARALRFSLIVTLLLGIILTLSYIRMYLFLYAGLAMVLMELCWQDATVPSTAGRDR